MACEHRRRVLLDLSGGQKTVLSGCASVNQDIRKLANSVNGFRTTLAQDIQELTNWHARHGKASVASVELDKAAAQTPR